MTNPSGQLLRENCNLSAASDTYIYLNPRKYCIIMKAKTVTIPKEEYERLKKIEKLDKALLEDIAHGIKDILSGKVKEV